MTHLALRHTMKFQPDRSDAQTIHGYGPGWIGVDGEKHTQTAGKPTVSERQD
jgi:hypothetical protein